MAPFLETLTPPSLFSNPVLLHSLSIFIFNFNSPLILITFNPTAEKQLIFNNQFHSRIMSTIKGFLFLLLLSFSFASIEFQNYGSRRNNNQATSKQPINNIFRVVNKSFQFNVNIVYNYGNDQWETKINVEGTCVSEKFSVSLKQIYGAYEIYEIQSLGRIRRNLYCQSIQAQQSFLDTQIKNGNGLAYSYQKASNSRGWNQIDLVLVSGRNTIAIAPL